MEKKENRLARMLIDTAVYELKHMYDDLVYPLSKLQWKESEKRRHREALYTDGMTCYYDPDLIVRHNKEYIQYNILHILLHGLLGHFQIKDDYKDTACRDVMMDVQVGYLMQRLQMFSELCKVKELDVLLGKNYSMGQYHKLIKNKEFAVNRSYYQQVCKVDNHEFWDMEKDSVKKKQLILFWQNIQMVVLGEVIQEIGGDIGSEIAGLVLTEGVSGTEGGPVSCNGLQMVADILGKQKGRGKGFGNGRGNGKDSFAVGQDSLQDYGELLKDLFSRKEISREEPDSIDPMFYYYGMELYADTPLIEPLETCEKPVFRTLAIAIDVSGSCVTEAVMKSFWGETFHCISQLKEQHAEGDILLLQCDDGIQSEEKIALSDFVKAPDRISVTGMGGTSFVPVFKRLEELEEQGEGMDALLYLTDGAGRYPKKKPDYPVYFVIPENDLAQVDYYDMPDWITKICLKETA